MFVHQQQFKDSIPFLKQFEFVSSGIQKDDTHDWLFSKNWKDNSLMIKISKKDNNWTISVDYESRYSKEIGSDIIWSFVGKYEDFVNFIINKLKNNPLINPNLLNNDLESLEEQEILKGIKRVLEKGEKIDLLKNGYLDDLKKLLNLLRSMKGISTKEKLLKILRDVYRTYRPIVMILNKVDMVDYYLSLQKNELVYEKGI